MRRTQSETRLGAIVGGFVGLLYGTVNAVNLYVVFPRISAVLSRSASTFVGTTYVPFVVGIPFAFGLLGLVLGAIFVESRKHIPGSSIIDKSVAFSFILMAIAVILSWRPGAKMPAITIEQITLGSIFFAANFAPFPLLGWLFGYLLQRRLKPKTQ